MNESKGVVTYWAIRWVGADRDMRDSWSDSYADALDVRDKNVKSGWPREDMEIVRVEITPC